MTLDIYATGAVTTLFVVLAIVKPWRYPKKSPATLYEEMLCRSDGWFACLGYSLSWLITIPITLLVGVFTLSILGFLKLMSHLVDDSTDKKEKE